VRPRAAEHATGGVARRHRIERGLHTDGDRALEDRVPDLARLDEHVQPLLADRGAGIAADGRHRRVVVEAFAGTVEVDDLERGPRGGRRKRQQQACEQYEVPRPGAHRCSCFGAAASTRARISASEDTQSCSSRPSASVVTKTYWRNAAPTIAWREPSAWRTTFCAAIARASACVRASAIALVEGVPSTTVASPVSGSKRMPATMGVVMRHGPGWSFTRFVAEDGAGCASASKGVAARSRSDVTIVRMSRASGRSADVAGGEGHSMIPHAGTREGGPKASLARASCNGAEGP